jgi:hypothetical protein
MILKKQKSPYAFNFVFSILFLLISLQYILIQDIDKTHKLYSAATYSNK